LNKLDQTWIHPESYSIAKKYLKHLKFTVDDIGSSKLVTASIDAGSSLVDHFLHFGSDLETIKMIKAAFENEEEKYRQDNSYVFKRKITEVAELKVGMALTGQVENIAGFGVFVNIGVEENGLIPNRLIGGRQLCTNQRVKVKIDSIQTQTKPKRIALSLL